MLTKNDIKALRAIGLSERQILFIQKFVKNVCQIEGLDKESALIEILGVDRYNDFLANR